VVDLSHQQIAVTGATGFVGRHVVASLRARGAHVIAAVRRVEAARVMFPEDVEARPFDLTAPDGMCHAFAGSHAVVHAAATISIGGHAVHTVVQNNVLGTERVMRAVAQAGVPRVIQISSANVYVPRADRVYHEDHALFAADHTPHRFNAYGVSKAGAEHAAVGLAESAGISLTRLRPQAIHGAWDRGSLTLWFKRLLSIPVSVFPTGTYLPSVYAGDLAEAVCQCLEQPEVSAGRAYNIAGDPGAYTLWDLKNAWADAGGRVPFIVLPIPVPFRIALDITRARTELGWKNRPLADGFREMIQRERQLLATSSPSSPRLTESPRG
jgi:nucleoside-diphosphate-sugar epimerase